MLPVWLGWFNSFLWAITFTGENLSLFVYFLIQASYLVYHYWCEQFLKVLINLRASLSPFTSPQIFCLTYFLPLPIFCAYFKWKYIDFSVGIRLLFCLFLNMPILSEKSHIQKQDLFLLIECNCVIYLLLVRSVQLIYSFLFTV